MTNQHTNQVARRLLFSDKIWPFFDTYVHLPNFDVASDSFATLKDVLCRHRSVAAEFLEKEYDHVRVYVCSRQFE